MTADGKAKGECSVIAIGGDGWVGTYPALPEDDTATAHAFHRSWWRGVVFFHVDGQRYEVASAAAEPPRGVLSRFLAATVYNPRIRVRYRYRRVAPYTMAELKEALGAAIEADDDVLTQFEEADELRGRLDEASSFDEVVTVLTDDHDER